MNDDLPVEAQVNGFNLVILLPPSLQMRDVGFVAIQKIGIAKVNEHRPIVVGDRDLHVLGIAQINFAQIFGISCAAGIESDSINSPSTRVPTTELLPLRT